MNPTEVPVVEAIRTVSLAQLWPLLLEWPWVRDTLYMTREGSSWVVVPDRIHWVRTVWWN